MVSVVIIGGGVGGLTATHHLAKRGADVTVLEANDRFGGKARSIPIEDGPTGLHGEHGFRFFPAYYRHVVDTMAQIPAENGTVADNLVETESTLFASSRGPNRVAPTTTPTSVREWIDVFQPAFAGALPPGDTGVLVERFLYLLTSCQNRREEELDMISWWEFVDAENRSPEFCDRFINATQSLVALQPQLGSARTIGTIYLQLLFGQLDPTRPGERVLNAPTSEAWIDPWTEYLETLGVDFQPNSPAAGFEFDGQRITGVELTTGSVVTGDEYVLAVPVEVAPSFITPELVHAAPELGRIDRLDTNWMNGIQFFLSEDIELNSGHQLYVDSPWALTSISQRQFWSGYDITDHGPDDVAGVLSVIASDWNTPGILYNKPARKCTRAEISTEIWEQLKRHINGPEQRLTDEMLIDWFLDPSIVETDSDDGDVVTNRSPLLINTVGSLQNRPSADVAIPNLTLASDYVRTNSDLASMESADEAGRRAANTIADRHGLTGSRATIWELPEPPVFEPFKRQDRLRYRLGLPHPATIGQSIREGIPRLSNW